jgi:hypothetical protein
VGRRADTTPAALPRLRRRRSAPAPAAAERAGRAAAARRAARPVRLPLSLRRHCAPHAAHGGALEQLAGSGSLFGAVEAQLLLRTCSALGALLFALWALSPVGRQAALRLLDVRAAASESTRTLWYVAQGREPETHFAGGTLANGRDTIAALYQAAKR